MPPRISRQFVIVLATLLIGLTAATNAVQKQNAPVWAKKGVAFPTACPPSSGCETLRILSPDRKSAVEASYTSDSRNPDLKTVSLRVTSSGRLLGDVQLVGDAENEITWSPDSTAFFINGSDSGYTENAVAVHYLEDPNLGPGYITEAVAQDMVRSFLPCKVKNPSESCAQLAASPRDFINVVGIDWIGNSSGLVVMAEVPCTSSMGGIMCQVLGYELSLPSGKIVRRMEPREFARRWQRSMAWTFKIPEPAEFEK